MAEACKEFSKDELAAYLSLKPRTIANYAKRKVNPLPHTKVPINKSGSWKYKFKEDEVLEWLLGRAGGKNVGN